MIEEKRTESSELTAVLPRSSLPPVSTRPLSIEDLADLDFEHVAREADAGRITMVVCPLCKDGLCTPDQREAWLVKYPDLAADVDASPDSQPPDAA